MRPWMVLILILLLLWLVSLVRVGGEVDYTAAGFQVRLRVGPLRFTVYPLKRRRRRPRREKPSKPAPKPAEEERTGGGSLALLRELLPLIAEAAGRLRRKLRVDWLDLELVLAAGDPAAAALAFGGANAALGMILPLLEQNFTIRRRDIRTAVDFDRKTPAVTLRAALTLTIGQGVAFAFHLAWKALPVLLKYRGGDGQRVHP